MSMSWNTEYRLRRAIRDGDEGDGWNKPRRVFLDSMSDLFHDVPDEVFETIFKGNRRHTYLYLGVRVENQQAVEERVPYLLQTPAPAAVRLVRFVICEPLLGPVNLTNVQYRDEWHWDVLRGFQWKGGFTDYQAGTAMIDLVICGGESGPGARPMHLDWSRSLRDQCVDAGVPFFFKQ